MDLITHLKAIAMLIMMPITMAVFAGIAQRGTEHGAGVVVPVAGGRPGEDGHRGGERPGTRQSGGHEKGVEHRGGGGIYCRTLAACRDFRTEHAFLLQKGTEYFRRYELPVRQVPHTHFRPPLPAHGLPYDGVAHDV